MEEMENYVTDLEITVQEDESGKHIVQFQINYTSGYSTQHDVEDSPGEKTVVFVFPEHLLHMAGLAIQHAVDVLNSRELPS